MNTTERQRVSDCTIGTADTSDHNTIHLTVNLEDLKRRTQQRLNIGILNKKTIVQEIKKETRDCNNLNKDNEVEPTTVWDTVKGVNCKHWWASGLITLSNTKVVSNNEKQSVSLNTGVNKNTPLTYCPIAWAYTLSSLLQTFPLNREMHPCFSLSRHPEIYLSNPPW